jgi:AcrR family transcriptional regulator
LLMETERTVEDVARAVGTVPSTLYRYVPGGARCS